MKQTSSSPCWRRTLTTTTAAVLAAAGLSFSAAPAHAAPQDVDDAVFQWGVNPLSSSGFFIGGSNFLVAGESGDAGARTTWGEAQRDLYKAEDGNVSIKMPKEDGSYAVPTWETRSFTGDGVNMNGKNKQYTHGEVWIDNGEGTVDPANNTAEIQWDGAFTVAFYGGMTYWTAFDPKLIINEDGTGELTADLGGYAASMADAGKWEKLEPRSAQLATFTDVEITEDGLIDAQPDYLGVEFEIPEDVDSYFAQQRSGSHWGSFPQSFVEFQLVTEQSSYWYSSGSSSGPEKVAKPFTASWSLADEDTAPSESDADEVNINVTLEADDPDTPTPGVFSWSLASNETELGQATQNGAGGLKASGSLPTVSVTDTRETSQGWSMTGSAGDFLQHDGSEKFSGTVLGWIPTVTGSATPGARVEPNDPGLSASAVLASATSATGENTDVNAALSFLLPFQIDAGKYTSIMTLTAIGQ